MACRINGDVKTRSPPPCFLLVLITPPIPPFNKKRIYNQDDRNEIISTIGDKKITLPYALANPTTLILASGTGEDWYSQEWKYIDWANRWGSEDNPECGGYIAYKAEMDPCPEGWQVPKYTGDGNEYSPWALKDNYESKTPTDYTNEPWNNGWNFNSSHYNLGAYPAMPTISGYSAGSGIAGRYWTGTAKDRSNSRSFTIKLNSIENTNIYPREALAVRCVKDE